MAYVGLFLLHKYPFFINKVERDPENANLTLSTPSERNSPSALSGIVKDR